jgi:hypothetical protein
VEGKKVYLQPMTTVLNTINDIVELQNGKLTLSDTPGGKIHFLVRMYGSKWEYRFTVTDIGQNRCRVQIETDGDVRAREKKIRRGFALLDSMLVTAAQLEITETNGAERRLT